jgi:hypothetical protein
MNVFNWASVWRLGRYERGIPHGSGNTFPVSMTRSLATARAYSAYLVRDY